MAVFNVIPEIAPIFSTDILDYFIPDIFSCFNSKDVLLRSACIQFIPVCLFSLVSSIEDLLSSVYSYLPGCY